MSALRELKILAFVIIVVGILYWGVEPLAHSVFHPHTTPADFKFSDLEKLPTEGSVENGKTLATTFCVSCHSIEKEGFPMMMSKEDAIVAYGVIPPDLSNIGALYDGNFLANLIKDPVKTLKLGHKFGNDKFFPMPPSPLSDKELGDIVAYFKSIGEKNLQAQVLESSEYKSKVEAFQKNNNEAKLNALKEHITNKEVFISACNRCHSVKYDNVFSLTPSDNIAAYMGAKAPDLSMMIRSRGEDNLQKFINDPQKILSNAAMPRIGLNEVSQDRVIKYLENIGDSKKDERIFVGKILIGFMIIMAIFAYLWKRKIWRDLH
ncbi:c-type cytochrome [Helicobacter sp. MIT 14-3879]|uniref:c-type cytochrome n=1 Tax=Helicobacter sp. MIT 14-3879 TaxID=2040649 RepID=UPI000E1EC67C|nr:c-type cytochrome [Helicobacter sp. MIT 14-3879]RDU61639.1 cytochrome C [Helicobacter sp. MIT 14-3879]